MRTDAKLKKIEKSVLLLQSSVTFELIFPMVILKGLPHTKNNQPKMHLKSMKLSRYKTAVTSITYKNKFWNYLGCFMPKGSILITSVSFEQSSKILCLTSFWICTRTKQDGFTEIKGATLVENQGRSTTGITKITCLAMLL